MFQNAISKEFINEEIRPFSGNDSLFCSCVREAIQLDLSKLPADLSNALLSDLEGLDPDKETEIKALLEDGLRLALGYFTYSRALRTGQVTVTKYGATVKNAQDSYSADNDKVVSDSTYYKNCAEKYLSLFLTKHPEITSSNNTAVVDQYLKCNVIGE